MNVFAADPHWGWWIILYFYLGGIAAGAYFWATLIDLMGRPEDRILSRAGYTIAFPLIVVCGIFLIVDLNQPLRFWHMLLKSEVAKTAFDQGWPFSLGGWRTMAAAPLIKFWSPMSIGSWAISVFGLCSAISFVAVIGRGRFVERWYASRWCHPVRLVGCGVGLFVASYTGALLTATNQPLWSDTYWIASLFLASAISTGAAASVLLSGDQLTAATRERLHRADIWLVCLEIIVFILFLISLGAWLLPLLSNVHGLVLVGGTLAVGLLLPLWIYIRSHSANASAARLAAVCILIGGFALRWGLLTSPQELRSVSAPAAASASTLEFGPEAGRQRGEAGADPGNRPLTLKPRSKVFP